MSKSDQPKRFISIDYEVFGIVQGVFFRKYTFEAARQVGAVGWVMNTARGTVVGCVQGTEDQVSKMKKFLSEVGSPRSTIEGCDYKDEKEIINLEFRNFDVRPSPW